MRHTDSTSFPATGDCASFRNFAGPPSTQSYSSGKLGEKKVETFPGPTVRRSTLSNAIFMTSPLFQKGDLSICVPRGNFPREDFWEGECARESTNSPSVRW